MESMEETAKQICKNENNTRVRCQDGSYVKVPDAGGRHVAEKILQDVHSAARHFDNNMQQKLDSIAGKLDESTSVSVEALRVPTGEPLNMFAPSTWTCAFTEFFYGDATPNLDRQTPLLFEEWASCLLEREELEYALDTDTEKYRAISPSRFVKPEILACLHDGRRRLATIKGARMCLDRAGFRGDINHIAKTTVEDFFGRCG